MIVKDGAHRIQDMVKRGRLGEAWRSTEGNGPTGDRAGRRGREGGEGGCAPVAVLREDTIHLCQGTSPAQPNNLRSIVGQGSCGLWLAGTSWSSGSGSASRHELAEGRNASIARVGQQCQLLHKVPLGAGTTVELGVTAKDREAASERGILPTPLEHHKANNAGTAGSQASDVRQATALI